MSYSYPLYGLRLCSNAPIPGLWQQHRERKTTDILVEIGPEVPAWVRAARDMPSIKPTSEPPNHDCSVTIFGLDEFFELKYSEGTEFVIDAAGERVWATWLPPLTMEDLADYVRGPVMGHVLRLRNVTALHASVANLQGQAVVFCGESAAGKSTTAAALALRGIPILSEDVAALQFKGNRFHVQSGYPRISLWRDSVQSLLGTPDALSATSPVWEKCYLPLDGTLARFEPEERPLAAIYLLMPRARLNAPRIVEVHGREALLSLVQNTYFNKLLNREQRASEFDMLSKIVMNVPVRKIVPHVDVAKIGELCDLIVKDVEELASGERTAELGSDH